jgi:hypothetical protein
MNKTQFRSTYNFSLLDAKNKNFKTLENNGVNYSLINYNSKSLSRLGSNSKNRENNSPISNQNRTGINFGNNSTMKNVKARKIKLKRFSFKSNKKNG